MNPLLLTLAMITFTASNYAFHLGLFYLSREGNDRGYFIKAIESLAISAVSLIFGLN